MSWVTLPNAFATKAKIPAEKLTLGAYTFLPYFRTGIAAAITTPFAPGAPTRGAVDVTVGVGPETAKVTVQIRGPGDVLALDPRQIIRRYPEPGTPDAEPSDLVHVELDSPDLPWQFTPTAPDSADHLPAWLRLVVVDAAVSTITATSGLARLTTPQSELPPSSDAWAWAHVQVLGSDTDAVSLADRLAPANPRANLARLLCPRRLQPMKSWIACLVPTFQAGVDAVNGAETITGDLRYAWTGGGGTVTLPVYDHWRFSTGADGDFEALATRLEPTPAGPSIGVRRVDMSHPGNGIRPLTPTDSGGLRHIAGALTSPAGVPADDQWPAASTAALRAQLHTTDDRQFDPAPRPDLTVGPPIYAAAHTALPRVDSTAPQWFADINLDPADRVVAGLGTRVVQMDQETLMTGAWAQVEGVQETNRALRATQLGRYAAEALHRRHLSVLTPADLLAVTDRVSSRLLDGDVTVRTAISASALPASSLCGAARRMLAPRGRYTRFVAPDGQQSAAVARSRAVRALLVDEYGVTRNWVRPYTDPDAVTAVSEWTAAATAADPYDLDQQLASPNLPGRLTDPAAITIGVTLPHYREQLLLGRILDAQLRSLPTKGDISASDSAAEIVADLSEQIESVLRATGIQGWDTLPIFADTADRFGIGRPLYEGVKQVTVSEVFAVVEEIRRAAVDAGYDRGEGPINDVVDVIVDLLGIPGPDQLITDFGGLGGPVVRPGGPRDRDRTGIRVDDLGLIGLLDPKITFTKRVKARLPDASLWPGWLPHNWFDDGRAEPVLAAPRFNHPMYEALDRYDREWLMPGVAAMTPHDMVTLLNANARFIEAFLVGLNAEFARELVWRGYPTDGRATSFYSFWTPATELTAPLDAKAPGPLGTHLATHVGDMTVMVVRGELVRRYPHVQAGLVQQAVNGPLPSSFRPPDASKEMFRLMLDPDLLVIGFAVTKQDILAADPEQTGAWWFTLSEHVGEPRFGLDEPAPNHPRPTKRDQLAWGDLPLNGPYLNPVDPGLALERQFRGDSAHVGWLLFQQPARAAFNARALLGAITSGTT